MAQEQDVLIESINPYIREFYHKYNLDYVPAAEDRAHGLFDQRLDGEAKTKVAIMYRVKKGFSRGKEYVYWWEAVNGLDRFGNQIQKRQIKGKWDKPNPEFTYDEKMKGPHCTGVKNFEVVYDTPFDVKLLDKMVEEEIIDENTRFAVDNGLIYHVADFDDFRNHSFDDLVYTGRTGIRPEQREEVLKNRERKRIGQNVD